MCIMSWTVLDDPSSFLYEIFILFTLSKVNLKKYPICESASRTACFFENHSSNLPAKAARKIFSRFMHSTNTFLNSKIPEIPVFPTKFDFFSRREGPLL